MSSVELNEGTMATPAATKADGLSTMQTTFALNGSTIGSPATTPLAGPNPPFLSPSTEEILKRVTARSASLGAGSAGWEAAREHVLKNMRTSDSITATPLRTLSPAGRGRGNGRGRGKGPSTGSKSDHDASPATTSTSTTELAAAKTSSVRARNGGRAKARGRGGRQAGKRKRDAFDGESIGEDDVSNDSDTYTPAQTTRSGRTIAKPATYVPTIPSPPQTSIKRRKVATRMPSARSVCKTCHRGHSPNANMIVFCDNCNTGYHQYCHHPPIEKDVVLIPNKEWICATCAQSKKPAAELNSMRNPTETPILDALDMDCMVPGDQWPESQRRKWFESLLHASLVSMLTHIAKTQPRSALFPSVYPPSKTQDQHPLTDGHHNKDGADSNSGTIPEELIDDDPPAKYPKPGLGLARHLPPESEHLQWLVDDNTDVFSHSFPAKDFKPISDETLNSQATTQGDSQQDVVLASKSDHDSSATHLPNKIGIESNEVEATFGIKVNGSPSPSGEIETIVEKVIGVTSVPVSTSHSQPSLRENHGINPGDQVDLDSSVADSSMQLDAFSGSGK